MSDALHDAMRYAECHEEVVRKGEVQPCENDAVAVRIDPDSGTFYPVCSRHTRRPMVRLTDLARVTSPGGQKPPPPGPGATARMVTEVAITRNLPPDGGRA